MCNRSHQMHHFLFPLWNSSRNQHMDFVISSNAPYVSFITIATNITIIGKKFLATVMSSLSIELSAVTVSLSVSYRLIDPSSPYRHFVFCSWQPQSISLKSKECSVFIIITKGMCFHCTKYQHHRYSQANTLITVYVCTRQPVTHWPHYPRSDDENMTSEWHCINAA